MIPRAIADKVRSDAAGFPIVAVLGPRQSGKSTLVTSIFDDYAYRNLEDPSVRQFAGEDPKVMLQSGESGMIIGELHAVDLGLSHNTVRAWMSVLEASYVVRLLRPFHRNFGKQTTKSPRLYFVDTGLVCALLEIDSPGSLRNHHLRGAIFENLVVNEIANSFVNEAKREPLSYSRDRRGNEVDLLVEKAENRVAVEAKAGMTIAGTWFRGLSYYGNLDPACPPENRYVVYGGDSSVSAFRNYAASSSTGWAITGTIANPRSSSVWRGKRSEQFNTPGHSVVNFVSGETWKWVPVETDSTAKRRSTA